MTTHRISAYRTAEAALRSPHLKQALYDAGAVVMADVLLTLHGADHAARRAVEVRVFRRNFLRHYAREVFPLTMEATLLPFIEQQGADLIELGYRVTANLTADFAGIDRPEQTADETEALIRLVKTFSEGATMVHSTRNKAELDREVLEALAEFDARFCRPSVERRIAILARGGADALPRDVLSVILEAGSELAIGDAELCREMAFYMQAGAHSTANAVVHGFHELSSWAGKDPVRRARLADAAFVQRAAHESLRLHPASPEAWRTATDAIRLPDATTIGIGDRVELDLYLANRDVDVFGPTAAVFDPDRTVPEGVMPSGLSFGIGLHSCLGRELDGGTLVRPGTDPDSHQYGIVAMLMARLFELGSRTDPADPPTRDPKTIRANWGRYPVRFGGVQ
ncbi:MAG: cytochrome P450 [Sandaracinobacteroides sp.]